MIYMYYLKSSQQLCKKRLYDCFSFIERNRYTDVRQPAPNSTGNNGLNSKSLALGAQLPHTSLPSTCVCVEGSALKCFSNSRAGSTAQW
jgi:hypothetical protein